MRLPYFLYLFILLGFCLPSQAAESLSWQLLRAPSISETTTQTPTSFLAVTITPPSGEYHYATAAEIGLPSTVLVQEQETGTAFPTFAPPSVLKKESSVAHIKQVGINDSNIQIYAGAATFVAELPPLTKETTLSITASALFCSATNCTPFSHTITLTLSPDMVTKAPPASDAPWWPHWQNKKYQPAQASTQLAASNTPSSSQTDAALSLDSLLSGATDEPTENDEKLFSSLTPRYFHPALEVNALSDALLLGLLAGLLLNLMPCVLPVISLKFSALLAVTAMTNKKEQARAFRQHCLIFAAGVLTWFIILAILLGGAGWAWGTLFQSSTALCVLALILFLLALSLFGVFSLPIFDLKVETKSHPHWQAFASGLLATLLATPCSGPLLGGVLGWAIRQPTLVLTLTIVCIGIGMSLPYCLLALYPGLIRFLPRPGTWTLRLEQLLGFFLLASVLYLAMLLPESWIPPFLLNLLVIAFAAWLWGQIGGLEASTLKRILARTSAVALVSLAAWWGIASLTANQTWEQFSAEDFRKSLGNERLLLEFTADWCPSCKALEKVTLTERRMTRLRMRHKMRTIRVDITHNDKLKQQLLEALGSSSIPLIALFPEGEQAKQPLILRDIVTPRQLKDALDEVF